MAGLCPPHLIIRLSLWQTPLQGRGGAGSAAVPSSGHSPYPNPKPDPQARRCFCYKCQFCDQTPGPSPPAIDSSTQDEPVLWLPQFPKITGSLSHASILHWSASLSPTASDTAQRQLAPTPARVTMATSSIKFPLSSQPWKREKSCRLKPSSPSSGCH